MRARAAGSLRGLGTRWPRIRQVCVKVDHVLVQVGRYDCGPEPPRHESQLSESVTLSESLTPSLPHVPVAVQVTDSELSPSERCPAPRAGRPTGVPACPRPSNRAGLLAYPAGCGPGPIGRVPQASRWWQAALEDHRIGRRGRAARGADRGRFGSLSGSASAVSSESVAFLLRFTIASRHFRLCFGDAGRCTFGFKFGSAARFWLRFGGASGAPGPGRELFFFCRDQAFSVFKRYIAKKTI